MRSTKENSLDMGGTRQILSSELQLGEKINMWFSSSPETGQTQNMQEKKRSCVTDKREALSEMKTMA